MHSPWGADDRDKKAHNIVQFLGLSIDQDLSQPICVDIGCGGGGISNHIVPGFKTIGGLGPELGSDGSISRQAAQNGFLEEGPVVDPGKACHLDKVIICDQVYEHTTSLQRSLARIYQMLKPGGICHLAGLNLLSPIEPHDLPRPYIHWRFIHWAPRAWALAILKKFARVKRQFPTSIP